MNDVSPLAAGPTKTLAEFPEVSTASHRGIFDVRIWITGSTSGEVFELARELTKLSRRLAPQGVDIRYTTLRPGHPLCGFKPTLEPKRSKGRR